jgi:hypothetical protein
MRISAFNYSRAAVQPALANGLNPPKSPGHHLAVDAEFEANILAWTKKQTEENAGVTRTDIKNDGGEVSKLDASWRRVNSFISRHSAELMEKENSPQEERGLQVRRFFLEETIQYAVCIQDSRVVSLN